MNIASFDPIRGASGGPIPFDALWLEAEKLGTVAVAGSKWTSEKTYSGEIYMTKLGIGDSTFYAKGTGQTPYHALANALRDALRVKTLYPS